jgi:hypothetical protein
MRRKLTAVLLASAFGLAVPVTTASADITPTPGKGESGYEPDGQVSGRAE